MKPTASTAAAAAEAARTALVDEAVGLQTQRVDAERIRLTLIVEGVQNDPDEVVAERDPVAFPETCENQLGLRVIRPNPEVDGFLGIEDPDLGLLRRLDSLNRHILRETSQDRRLTPRGLIQRTVHADARVDELRRCYLQLAHAPAVPNRVGRGVQQGDECEGLEHPAAVVGRA